MSCASRDTCVALPQPTVSPEVIRRGPRELIGCNVNGIYLLRFDANPKGGDGGVQGTFEGVIVCPCG
jgi:hypothetical protein